jgi:hypothetical protein
VAKDGEDRRFFGGPRPLGALLPRLTRPAFKRRSPAGAALMADWPAVVGPALAAVTAPKRLANGTLVIACAGPVAMELTHLAPQLIGRINAHLGQAAVERLRFVQQASSGPAGAAPRTAEPAVLPLRVQQAVDSVPAGELREALEKLAQGVYRNRDGSA